MDDIGFEGIEYRSQGGRTYSSCSWRAELTLLPADRLSWGRFL